MMLSEPTRPSLLLRIRDPGDSDAWNEFARIYTPLVYRYARHCGLQHADAEIVAQDVMVTVARRITQFAYDPQAGTFRGWLKVVARSRLADFVRSEKRAVRGSGDSRVQKSLESHDDGRGGDAQLWETEYRKSLFHWAAQQIRGDFQDSTWQAFWRTSVQGEPCQDVAQDLDMSVGAVYIARSRVLARLRSQIDAHNEDLPT